VIRPTLTRVPLALFMALIGVLALELAAMRVASSLASTAAFNLTLLVLLIGLLGALMRRGEGGWTGFALFGWSYAMFSFVPAFQQNTPGLLTAILLDDLAAKLHAPSLPTLNVQFLKVVGDPSNLLKYRKGSSDRTIHEGSPFTFDSRLTEADETALDAYITKYDLYKQTVDLAGERRIRACQVGQSLSILVLALVGAFLGKLIGLRRKPADAAMS